MGNILLFPVALLDGPLSPEAQHLIQLRFGHVQQPSPPCAAGNVAKELIQKLLQSWPNFAFTKRRSQQPNAAINIKTNSASRHDPFVQIGRGNATDAKTIALVRIRHSERTT